jgi:hypothetical protein
MMLWWLMTARGEGEYSDDESLVMDNQAYGLLNCGCDASVTAAVEAGEVCDCSNAASYVIPHEVDDILIVTRLKSYGKLTTVQLSIVRTKEAGRSPRWIAYALNNIPDLEALGTPCADHLFRRYECNRVSIMTGIEFALRGPDGCPVG